MMEAATPESSLGDSEYYDSALTPSPMHGHVHSTTSSTPSGHLGAAQMGSSGKKAVNRGRWTKEEVRITNPCNSTVD